MIQYYPYIKVLKGPVKFVYYIEGLLYWRFMSINNSRYTSIMIDTIQYLKGFDNSLRYHYPCYLWNHDMKYANFIKIQLFFYI